MKKILSGIVDWVKPYMTPRMIPIVISIWAITNGVWYVLAFAPLGLPTWLKIFAISYLGFLWSPIGIEKPLIILISGALYRIIYKENFKRRDYESIDKK